MKPSPEIKRKPTAEILKPLEEDEKYYKDKLDDLNQKIVKLKEKVEPHTKAIIKQTSDPLMFGVEIARRMEEAIRYFEEVIVAFEDRDEVYKRMFETIKKTIPEFYLLRGTGEKEIEDLRKQRDFWKERYNEDDFERATVLRMLFSGRSPIDQRTEYARITGKSKETYTSTVERMRDMLKTRTSRSVQPSPLVSEMVKKAEASPTTEQDAPTEVIDDETEE